MGIGCFNADSNSVLTLLILGLPILFHNSMDMKLSPAPVSNSK
jgi:hypothetical protein